MLLFFLGCILLVICQYSICAWGRGTHMHVHTCFLVLNPSVVRVPYDALNFFFFYNL